jgi:hypothetical protein
VKLTFSLSPTDFGEKYSAGNTDEAEQIIDTELDTDEAEQIIDTGLDTDEQMRRSTSSIPDLIQMRRSTSSIPDLSVPVNKDFETKPEVY